MLGKIPSKQLLPLFNMVKYSGCYTIMNVRSFFKYVEIQTKAASIIPFAAGTVFAFYRFQKFNFINFTLMLLSLLSFDMTTTAINNYIDYKSARKKFGYGFEKHNAIVRYSIKESEALSVIIILGFIAVLAGCILFLNTNIVVLLLGMVSFAIGVLYTAGPVPISRTPLGELFSGFFMGFVIPFLSYYIHVTDEQIIIFSLSDGILNAGFDLNEIFAVFIYSLPAIIGIANIMLANNICDIEEDLENNRYTLPIYIGKKKALVIFKILYYAAYTAALISIITEILPVTTLLFFITLIPVSKNISKFNQIQTKKDTFSLSVKNFALMNIALIISVILGIVIL